MYLTVKDRLRKVATKGFIGECKIMSLEIAELEKVTIMKRQPGAHKTAGQL